MKIYCIQNKESYEVDINKNGGNYSGICPVCSSDRKNKNAKSFSFNVSGGMGKCHNCESTFTIYREFSPAYRVPEKVYNKPKPKAILDLHPDTIAYFASRGITTKTLYDMKISDGVEVMPKSGAALTISFNYYRNDELVNIKYRAVKQKDFRLFPGGELIIYNLDGIKDSDKMIWCEGEFDQLSYFECGLNFAVSVPNGASKSAQKLEYIDNCIDFIPEGMIHYISTDDDEPGRALKKELIRRFGAENCKYIDLEGEKDANDFLQKYGRSGLLSAFHNAKDVPLAGVFSVDDNINNIIDVWRNGLPPGLDLYHENANRHVTWVSGVLAVWTGIPGHGKSEMVDEVNVHLNIKHGWKSAYFSPENFPEVNHIAKLIPKLSGKRFSAEHMSYDSFMTHVNYMKENFFFIRPDDDNLSIESILDHAKSLIRRYGVKILTIDPWNKIEHLLERGETETQYINRTLDKIINFAQRNDILIHLVAHPTKMKKEKGMYEKPTLYDISGSAHFYNKAFYGFCVYRHVDMVDFDIQKVKFRHLGTPGTVNFRFNMNNGRYVVCDDPLEVGVAWDNSSFLAKLTEDVEAYEQELFNQADAPF